MSGDRWTVDKDREAVQILKDDETTSMQKTQRYYHVRRNFELTILGDVERVRRKGGGLMVPIEHMSGIVRDIHIACNHKGETKTHKKVQEQYANIPIAVVKQVILNCERCTEKAKKKSAKNVAV